MKFTKYFEAMRSRPDRAMIKLEWVQRVIEQPVKEEIQQDGRIRRWAPIRGAGRKVSPRYTTSRRRNRA